MNKPTLTGLAEWMDTGLLKQVDQQRKADGEIKRKRKLGTVEMLWLMLAVALDTGKSGLHEILRLATADIGINWSVSVPAFCKARIFFRYATCIFFMAA